MLPAIRLHGDQLSGFRDVHEMFAPTLIGLLGLFGSIVDSELLFKFKSYPYKLVSCRVMPACGRARAQVNHVGMFTNPPVVPGKSHCKASVCGINAALHLYYWGTVWNYTWKIWLAFYDRNVVRTQSPKIFQIQYWMLLSDILPEDPTAMVP